MKTKERENMSDLKAAYINELIKMRRKSKIITGAVISLAAALIWQIALSVIGSGIGIRVSDGASFALSVLSFYTASLLPLFATFVVIDSFNGEFSANTMKQTLVRPINRLGIYISKVAAIASYVFLSLMFMLLLTTLIGFITEPGSFSFLSLWRIVVAYLVTWFPMMTFMLLIVMLAQFSRNGILTFFMAIFTYLALIALRFFFPQLSNMLIVPLFDWYIGWIADMNNLGILFRQGMLLLSSSLIFFGIGCRLFEGKEL
jgi:ABC-2 type transport system permease protein